MTRIFPRTTNWRVLGRNALGFALTISGTVIATTGQILLIGGLQLHALGVRLNRE